ncbi:MAG: hypothetical protein K2X87_12560 [Gemmataceae bacterium]|nr:hypothetical protein [Gemmataceae bacterium]
MRRMIVRAAVAVGAAGAVVAVGSARQPAPVPKALPAIPPFVGGAPDSNKLRADADALARERAEAAKDMGPPAVATERAVLQAQLLDLLKRLGDRPAPAPAPRGPNPPTRFEVPDRVRPADAVRMAENLFRDKDYDACLRVLRLTDRTQLGREERAFAQYLTACCLRLTDRRAEAASIYREVADAREDEFLAECAVSQLALMRSAEELQAQLRQLDIRPKPR